MKKYNERYEYQFVRWHAVSENKALNKALLPLIEEYKNHYISVNGLPTTKKQSANLSHNKYHLKEMIFGLIADDWIGVISRRKEDYKRSQYKPVRWTYANTIPKIDWLISNGYITQQLGDNYTHTSTIIFATDKLRNMVKKSNLSDYQIRTAIIPALDEINFVEFNQKDEEDIKTLLEYNQYDFCDRDWRKITKDKTMLKAYNKLYQDSNITLSINDYDSLTEEQITDLTLFIYNNRISLRFYNGDYELPENQQIKPPNPYQDEPKAKTERSSTLSIDGTTQKSQNKLKPLSQRLLESKKWLSKFVQYTMEIHIECYLIRIWTRDLSMQYGGRYYYRPMHGISPQSIPKSLRKQFMLINGEHVEEPDYSALHIRMLYQMYAREVEIPENCYEHKTIKREHMKIMALIAINSKTENEACWAFKKEFEEVSYTEAKYILEQFKELHKPIAQYICSDIGIKLQRKDSDIMTWLIREFTNKGTIVCPIHDSVIIQAKYHKELIDAMIMHYAHELQVFNFDVKVKP